MRRHLLLLAALLGALAIAVPSVEARTVSTHRIERAFLMTCPHLNRAKVRIWSKVLREEAMKRSFCPYTGVAIVKFETGSSCNERLVYDRMPREYSVGLGQINVIHHRDCRNGGLESPGCQSYINMLKDGASNLRVMSSMITLNRRMCRSRTGHPALFARWLSSYGGYNNSRGRKGVWCNMRKDRRGRWRDVKVPSHTRNVIQYRRQLLRSLG